MNGLGRFGGLLAGFAFAMLLVAFAVYVVGFRFNLSGSIPIGLYRVIKAPIRRGSVVLACLPATTAALARSRGYIAKGSCDDGSAPIGKTVAAMSGDTVMLRRQFISVNGKVLKNSRSLTRDSRYRSLPSIPEGSYIVRPGELWLISSYSGASFDSRYFGPVPTTRVVARISRVGD